MGLGRPWFYSRGFFFIQFVVKTTVVHVLPIKHKQNTDKATQVFFSSGRGLVLFSSFFYGSYTVFYATRFISQPQEYLTKEKQAIMRVEWEFRSKLYNQDLLAKYFLSLRWIGLFSINPICLLILPLVIMQGYIQQNLPNFYQRTEIT